MVIKNSILKLVANKELNFVELVKNLENGNIFKQLIDETYNLIYGRNYEDKNAIIDLSFQDMRDKITNYFRRSGCYYDIFYNQLTDINVIFNNFIDALEKKEKYKVTGMGHSAANISKKRFILPYGVSAGYKIKADEEFNQLIKNDFEGWNFEFPKYCSVKEFNELFCQ